MIQISDFYSEAARATVTARAEAAEPGHQRHGPHRRYFRSATQSKKDFAANQGMEWVKRCDKGSLEPVWRAVVARPAAAAGWRCSAERLRGPSKGPILRSQGRRSAARGRREASQRLPCRSPVEACALADTGVWHGTASQCAKPAHCLLRTSFHIHYVPSHCAAGGSDGRSTTSTSRCHRGSVAYAQQ